MAVSSPIAHTMTVLSARLYLDRIVLRIHLDDRCVLFTGEPDPAWCREWTWGVNPPEGLSPEQWQQTILDETMLLAQHAWHEQASPDPGIALSYEGMTIP